MTLSVALHSPTHARVSTFEIQGTPHSCVRFVSNDGHIELYFSGDDVGLAKALADVFNRIEPMLR